MKRNAFLCGALAALFLRPPTPVAAYDNISLAGTVSFKKVISRAAGIAAAPNGDVLIADAAGTLRVYSPDGKPKGTVGAKGKGADQLAVSDEGLWVSRWETNTVSLVDPTSGKLVRTLVSGTAPVGNYHQVWDGNDARGARLGTGVYQYKLQVGTQSRSGKVIRL